jgi:hypothetical protein
VEVLANETVVVNLAVDGKDDRVVLVGQGLSTRLCVRLVPVYVAVNTRSTYRRQQCSDAHGRELQTGQSSYPGPFGVN